MIRDLDQLTLELNAVDEAILAQIDSLVREWREDNPNAVKLTLHDARKNGRPVFAELFVARANVLAALTSIQLQKERETIKPTEENAQYVVNVFEREAEGVLQTEYTRLKNNHSILRGSELKRYHHLQDHMNLGDVFCHCDDPNGPVRSQPRLGRIVPSINAIKGFADRVDQLIEDSFGPARFTSGDLNYLQDRLVQKLKDETGEEEPEEPRGSAFIMHAFNVRLEGIGEINNLSWSPDGQVTLKFKHLTTFGQELLGKKYARD